jgi:hypothetical protein
MRIAVLTPLRTLDEPTISVSVCHLTPWYGRWKWATCQNQCVGGGPLSTIVLLAPLFGEWRLVYTSPWKEPSIGTPATRLIPRTYCKLGVRRNGRVVLSQHSASSRRFISRRSTTNSGGLRRANFVRGERDSGLLFASTLVPEFPTGRRNVSRPALCATHE